MGGLGGKWVSGGGGKKGDRGGWGWGESRVDTVSLYNLNFKKKDVPALPRRDSLYTNCVD